LKLKLKQMENQLKARIKQLSKELEQNYDSVKFGQIEELKRLLRIIEETFITSFADYMMEVKTKCISFNLTIEDVINNIPHFYDCYNRELTANKALLLLKNEKESM